MSSRRARWRRRLRERGMIRVIFCRLTLQVSCHRNRLVVVSTRLPNDSNLLSVKTLSNGPCPALTTMTSQHVPPPSRTPLKRYSTTPRRARVPPPPSWTTHSVTLGSTQTAGTRRIRLPLLASTSRAISRS